MKDGVQVQVIGTPIQIRLNGLAAVHGPLVRKPTKMGGDSWYPQSVVLGYRTETPTICPDVTSINLLGLQVELSSVRSSNRTRGDGTTSERGVKIELNEVNGLDNAFHSTWSTVDHPTESRRGH